MPVTLRERLANNDGILLLDGGTGEELFSEHGGVPDDREIWSARAVIDPQYHENLKRVHTSFLQAGAQAITTNSYGIVPGVGFTDPSEIARHFATAGELARQAVGDYNSLVFGSLGPLLESYRPDKLMPHNEGAAAYATMATALAPYVDAWIAETMSSCEESLQVVDGVSRVVASQNLPLLVSFTLDSEGHFRSDERVTIAIPRLLDYAQDHGVDVLGVLFNCAQPEAITMALEEIQQDTKLQQRLADHHVLLGAYANRQPPVPKDWALSETASPVMRADLTPLVYHDNFVQKWTQTLNVKMVGGCCGMTPAHIEELASRLTLKELQ